MFCCLKDLICLLILSFKNPHKDPKEPRRAKVQRKMWDSSHPCQFPCIESWGEGPWMQKCLITIERGKKSNGEIAIQCKASHAVSSGDSLPSSRQLRTAIASEDLSLAVGGDGKSWGEGKDPCWWKALSEISSEGVTGGGRAERQFLWVPGMLGEVIWTRTRVLAACLTNQNRARSVFLTILCCANVYTSLVLSN